MLVGMMLVGGGVMLLWGAVTGHHPWSPVVEAFGGDPLPDPGSGSAPTATVTIPTGAGAGVGAAAPTTFAPPAGTNGALSSRQVYALARSVGFTPTQAANMTAIAYRESRWIPSATNSIGATGLWQIYPGGPRYLDPVQNAQAARAKFLGSQAAGYSGYRPWASSRPPGSPF